MYSDEVNLTGTNVMELLYLANKYMVPSLADRCSEYLLKNVDGSNVFSVLPNAQMYEYEFLVDRCWEVIDKQTEEAMISEAFVTIERALLEAVIERDSLNVKEIELFKAVDLWAAKECSRQGLKENGETKRKILGERIVKGIRFPVMKQEEFASVVLDSNLLIYSELCDMMKYFSSVLSSPSGFTTSGRNETLQELCRFSSVAPCRWQSPCDHSPEGIDFTVDKSILLHGFRLFGSHGNSYIVALSIRDMDNKSLMVAEGGTFVSRYMKSDLGEYYGFDLLFKPPVALTKNTKYCVVAYIDGPSSYSGENGSETALCGKVTFRFYRCAHKLNRTGVTEGQFPTFLFSTRKLNVTALGKMTSIMSEGDSRLRRIVSGRKRVVSKFLDPEFC